MTIALVSLGLAIAATLSSGRSSKEKGGIIALVVLLIVGAPISEVVAPGSPWPLILSGLTIMLGAFALAARVEQQKQPGFLITGACPFCDEAFSCHPDDEGKSRTCASCENIFPNSGNPDYLAEYARDARELTAAFDGNELDPSNPAPEDMTEIAMTSDPILGSHIQMDKDDQPGGSA